MKNSIRKISMSVVAGTIIFGNIVSVNAAPMKTNFNYGSYKTIVFKDMYKNNKINNTQGKEANTPNNNTTIDKNNQVENSQKPVANNSNSSMEAEVLRLVNVERSKAGLSPLKMSNELSDVARRKSQDMADKNYFSHTSPTYGSPFDMMKQFGIKYTAAGENIAKGYNSAEAVMKGWMNSPGHKANILSSKYGTLGVGYVNKGGTTYWTQMFTN